MCDTDFDTTHFNSMVLKPQWPLKKVDGLAQAQAPSDHHKRTENHNNT